MAQEAKITSVAPEHRVRMTEISWDSITEAGAYVEKGTGDLYRIPQEALLHGSSPLIRKESVGGSSLVQLSRNPFITTLEARMLSCENNVTPNF
ncbi:MAG: hypothetical protein HYV16_00245 [Gammaproteobacteria bacterium]|nr:hypothetical protein [Gammaproteobacteria bacterium]